MFKISITSLIPHLFTKVVIPYEFSYDVPRNLAIFLSNDGVLGSLEIGCSTVRVSSYSSLSFCTVLR